MDDETKMNDTSYPTIIENIESFIECLEEDVKNLESAINEKWKGEWNYPQNVRAEMRVEQRLQSAIAKKLREILSSPTSKTEVET